MAARSALAYSNQLIVLRYHGVSQEDEHLWNPRLFIPPEHLAARVRFLQARGFSFVTLDEARRRTRDGTLPPRSVALVFETGYVDFVRLALPVLRAYKATATVYVPEKPAADHAQLADVAAGYMAWRSGMLDRPLANRSGRAPVLSDSAMARMAEDPQPSTGASQRQLEQLADDLNFDLQHLRRRRMLHLMSRDDAERAAEAGIEVRRQPIDTSSVRWELRDTTGLTLREFETWLAGTGALSEGSGRQAGRRTSFLRNVAWGWLAVGVNLLVGILLSPIIIRRLGVEQYGVWVLLFSLLDYMRVLDFGFRAAVVNGCARYYARHDWEGVSRTVVSALAYFFAIGAACLVLAIALKGPLIRAVDVSPALQADAQVLIVLIAITVSIRLVLSPLTATLEALQRFDLVNHAYIGSLLFRSTASLAVLFAGFGLIEMAWVVVAAQIGESAYTLFKLRQVCPELHLSPSLIRRDVLWNLFGYGRYSAVISASNLVTINSPAIVLGYLRSAAEVGYFALPFRLLMYSAEGLTKVADVTSSVTAALDETGNRDKVWRLAVLTNRQCFALFVPVAIFLSLYGTPLLYLWVTPDMAENSGHLLPIMVLSFAFAMSGQYNAGAILIGQARHRVFAYGTAVEAVATIVGLLAFVPQYGVVGAAWVVTVVALVIRGAYLAVALCRQNGFPLADYLWGVYGRGLLTAIPVIAIAVGCRSLGLDGDRWIELLLSAVLIFSSYFLIGFFSVLEPEHRQMALRRLRLGTAAASAERLV